MSTGIATDYDSPWKEALAHYLPDALALFLPAVYAAIDWSRGYTLLDKELQQVTRDADLGRRLADTLVQVWTHAGRDVWVLVHLEVQGRPEQDFARRMFIYYYRIFDRYARPILSIAVLADEEASWRPARFAQELWGCRVGLEYPVVKLLDWNERRAELAVSANPFAVVVLAQLVALETRGEAAARGRAKVGLIRGLYQRGFPRERVLELLRLIDWLVAVPPEVERDVWRTLEALEKEQEMPYVTSFERIGRAEGEAAGRVAGRVDGQRALLRRLIEHRFGVLPEDLEGRIAAADEAALAAMADRLLTAATVEELLAGA